MTPLEITQCLHLAQSLNLIVSSRTINGVLHVYTASGYAKPWASFIADYPLERLCAMAEREQLRSKLVS